MWSGLLLTEWVPHVLLVHNPVQQQQQAQMWVLVWPRLMLLTPLPLRLRLLLPWLTRMPQPHALLRLPRARPSPPPWQCWDAAGPAAQVVVVVVVRARSRPWVPSVA